MSDQQYEDGQEPGTSQARPRFDHLFPWPEFHERATMSPPLLEIRSGGEHPTLRQARPVFASADAMRRLAPPGEIEISLEEELRINVMAQVFGYICLNADGFVEHDLVPPGQLSVDLLRALHYVWLDRDPSSPNPCPSVERVAELTRGFSSARK